MLWVEIGVKLPHCEVGVQVQLTPANLGSLATVAAMPQVPLTIMELGGAKPGEKVTVIGIWFECWLPQAEKKIKSDAQAKARRSELRNVGWGRGIGSGIGEV